MNIKPIRMAYSSLLNLSAAQINVPLKGKASYGVTLAKDASTTAGSAVAYTLNNIPLTDAVNVVTSLLAGMTTSRRESVVDVVATAIGRATANGCVEQHAFSAGCNTFVETRVSMFINSFTGRIKFDIELVLAEGRAAHDAKATYDATSLNIPSTKQYPLSPKLSPQLI